MKCKEFVLCDGDTITNQQILEIAMRQSAVDSNCDWQDFMGEQNNEYLHQKLE